MNFYFPDFDFPKIKKKFQNLFLVLAVLAGLVFWREINKLSDGRLKIVFCDVGQGQAVYIKTPDNRDFLYDTGPGDKVLACLAKYMPFWDREIDGVFISHSQADHAGGLIPLLRRYTLKYLFMESYSGEAGVFQNISKEIKEYKKDHRNGGKGELIIVAPQAGKKIRGGAVEFEIIWPESFGPGNLASGDLNERSVVVSLNYGVFRALLTGDIDQTTQDYYLLNKSAASPVSLFQVPHHGSGKNLAAKFWQAIKPKLAVISVGKNTFGHPGRETLEELKILGAQVERTDERGDIVVETDGVQTWTAR